MKRMAKVLDEDGKLIEVDINDLCTGNILSPNLPDSLLKRIAKIHSFAKEFDKCTLEEFEISFMRDKHPENEVFVWECIMEAFNRCIELFPKDIKTKQSIFGTLVTISINALTEKEEQIDTVKQIKSILLEVIKEKQGE
jgi:hypothetical protein